MELVEGREDLSQRIAPGAISVDEAFADREADRRGARSSASRLRSVKECHPEAGACVGKSNANNEILMITILGAGGAIGNELVKLLAAKNQPFRLVGRNPKATPGATETLAADLTDRDQTIRAVAGSSVVHLLVGLKYDHRVWQDMWPRIMSNTIEACKRAGAKLIFFDNVYMYGKVSGPMTEETPFNPCSKKGEIRAKIASDAHQRVEVGRTHRDDCPLRRFLRPRHAERRHQSARLPASRPEAQSVMAGERCGPALLHLHAGCRAQPGAARGADDRLESNLARSHHTQSAHGKEFVALAAKEFGVAPRHRVLSRPMLRVAGWFDPLVAESYEMLYQSDGPYLFDSSKFAREFGFAGTPYADGIRTTAASFKRDARR